MFYRSIRANGTFTLRVTRWCCTLAILSLIGCSGDSSNSDSPRKITMAINSDTPLAGELTVVTETPTRISLDISDGVNSWSVDFTEFKTNHILPLLGFRPNQTHTITVRAIDSDGNSVTVDQPPPLTTPALPAGFPTITVKSDPSLMEPGYTLFNVIQQRSSTQLDDILIIVDHSGEVVWYNRGPNFFDYRQLPNGNLLYMQNNKVFEMDMLGNQINKWSGITEIDHFHHELFPMSNGNFLAISAEVRSYDNYRTSELPSITTTEIANVVGDVIVEFDANGQLVKQWHLLDMLDPYRLGYGSLGDYWNPTFADSRDWTHGNAVIYDETDDSIIVSMRHQDAIMKFSRTTDVTAGTKSGKIKWILSPPDNWVAPYDQYLLKPTVLNSKVSDDSDVPVVTDKNFYTYHQHAPMLLPNGNIMVYDNGNFRQSPNINVTSYPSHVTFSRAVEYEIDENNMTAKLVWQYGPESKTDPAWNYSGALGDADLLPTTGNVLITHGSMLAKYEDTVGPYVKEWARVVEVTRPVVIGETEKEVFNMVVEDLDLTQATGWRVYRSERITNLYSKTLLAN